MGHQRPRAHPQRSVRWNVFVTRVPPETTVIVPRIVFPTALNGRTKTHVARLPTNRAERGTTRLPATIAVHETRPVLRTEPSARVTVKRTVKVLLPRGAGGLRTRRR
jgi:hypothetical protein